MNLKFTDNATVSRTEIERRVVVKNENYRHRDEVRRRIATLLMFKKYLRLTGEIFEAKVVRKEAGYFAVEVPGVTRAGILFSNDQFYESQAISVKFIGFSKDHMRFIFELMPQLPQQLHPKTEGVITVHALP